VALSKDWRRTAGGRRCYGTLITGGAVPGWVQENGAAGFSGLWRVSYAIKMSKFQAAPL